MAGNVMKVHFICSIAKMFSALSVVFLLGWAYAYFVLVFAFKMKRNENKWEGEAPLPLH